MKFVKPIFIVALLFLSSCATTGVQFNRISDIPADKGIIYLYRTTGIPLDLNLVRYVVFDGNEDQMCELKPNGYCQINAAPGEVQLSAQLKEKGSITFNVKPGHDYFIKAGVIASSLGNYKTHFSLVDNKIGAEEISNCKLLQTAETDWIVGTETIRPQHESIQFPPSMIPMDKAVVCLYRERKMLSAMDNFLISEKSSRIGTLRNGSYFCVATNPGKHIYGISVNQPGIFRSSRVNLKSGVINYFRFNVVDYTFNPIDEPEGIKIITNMKKE